MRRSLTSRTEEKKLAIKIEEEKLVHQVLKGRCLPSGN
jgi:hypothetical protein